MQGDYAGFRLVNMTYPSRPKEIVNWEQCQSNLNRRQPGRRPHLGQPGDRSWNSPTPAPSTAATVAYSTTDPARYTTPGAFCGDWPMYREPANPALGLPERGQEGVHIIDISDPKNPDVIGVRRHAVRLAHRDARSGPGQQSAADLQHASATRPSGADPAESR